VKELEEQSLAKLFVTAEDNKQHIALLVEMGKYESWPEIRHLYIRSRQKCRRSYGKTDRAGKGGS